jgi:hypothetical protein
METKIALAFGPTIAPSLIKYSHILSSATFEHLIKNILH